jgi:hypothetical protein
VGVAEAAMVRVEMANFRVVELEMTKLYFVEVEKVIV